MRSLWLALAAAVAACVLVGGAAAAGHVNVTEAGGATFPNRAFVIDLPASRALTIDGVAVSENGGPVADATLLPASVVGNHTFAVVLVVDASESMQGRPIASAMAAVRAFAARRNPNQQLALVTFNDSASVALPFTTSMQQISSALAQTPPVAYGTRIYDAVAKAEAMLSAAKLAAGSIVVLSDGADTGSRLSEKSAVAAALANHVKLYTIGLHSPSFDPSTLQSLAAQGGGEYAVALSTRQLAPLFDQLGARIASEYLLRYKSLAGPNLPIRVSVSVAGVGSGASAYRTPALALTPVPPYQPSLARRFWGSPIVMVLLALLAAAGLALLAIGLLEPRRSGLPARMAEFVSVRGLQTQGRRAGAPAGAPEEGQAAPAPPGLWARFDSGLEIAQIRTRGATLVAWTVVATLLVTLLVDLITGTFWYALIGLILVPIVVREWAVRKLARRRNQFAEQLPDTLGVISSALRAGHSFAGAFAVVVETSPEPMKSEMQRVVADEQLGVPLEDALDIVVRRMASRDLEQVALVAKLQREAGGNAAEVVDRVAETIRERFELRRLVQTLTVQGRMSRWIVSALPVVLLLVIYILNPHYMHPLVAHTTGKIVLVLAALLVIAGSLVIKKIVDIKI